MHINKLYWMKEINYNFHYMKDYYLNYAEFLYDAVNFLVLFNCLTFLEFRSKEFCLLG